MITLDVLGSIEISLILVLVSISISSIEIYANRTIYTSGDWLDWRYARLAFSHPIKPLELLFSNYLSGIALQLIRLLLAISTLVLLQFGADVALALMGLTVLQCLHSYRNPIGRDGSDQMTLIVLVGLSLFYAFPGSDTSRIAVAFVALQLALSYLSSGLAKISSRTWRGTNALSEIFNTVTYGRQTVSAVFYKYRHFSLLSAYAVMLWQATFPFSFLMPDHVFSLYLIGGVLFHLSIAIVMGLNTFFLSFMAAYPFIINFHSWLWTAS